MRAMRRLVWLLCILSGAGAHAVDGLPLTESDFRGTLGISPNVRLAYRGPDCNAVGFEAFSQAMHEPNVRADVDRAVDGTSITVTARRRGATACPIPYPPITELPAFALPDLTGKRVTAASLKGKPTLVSFYFAQCVPCILEVGPLNDFAAGRRDLNFLAVTFDEPDVARDFVTRFKLRWRVVPGARELIDRMGIKQYPTLALFDAGGRLLGTRRGGVHDELEAVTVKPQITRWVDGLLRTREAAPAR